VNRLPSPPIFIPVVDIPIVHFTPLRLSCGWLLTAEKNFPSTMRKLLSIESIVYGTAIAELILQNGY
jgi:hypothetical protein